ncbi:MAG: hypothetical protein RQ724_06465 [Desulfuromonadales bacterium]|nr:hypothetical protein [Desulfuromonadales bacterium]
MENKWLRTSRPLILGTLVLALLLCPSISLALGTVAGTAIKNKATASYQVGASTLTRESNEVTVTVAELIDLTAVSQDGGSLSVSPGDTDRYLTFLLTNTGNGTETFNLSVDNALATEQFDPTLVNIYQDVNGNGTYDTATDTVIPGGALTLAPDAAATLFIVNTIPTLRSDGTTPLVDGDIGTTALSVASATGSGAAGTVIVNGGDGGAIDAILGNAFPVIIAADYVASVVSVAINKTLVVADPFGGTVPMPGATITYSLVVTVTGTGSAGSLTITDPIPVNTTYKPGTLKLDTVTVTDAAADDAGEATGTPVNLLTVRLGDMPAGTKTITFAVTIN